MHRRHLMLSLAASALALSVATPAFTSYTPDRITLDEIAMARDIDRALDSAKFWYFDHAAMKKMFGVEIGAAKNDMELRFVLHSLVLDSRQREVIDRVRYINAIRVHLDKEYGSDYASAHILWMHRTGPVWQYSARQLMESGHFADLRSVATWLDPTIA